MVSRLIPRIALTARRKFRHSLNQFGLPGGVPTVPPCNLGVLTRSLMPTAMLAATECAVAELALVLLLGGTARLARRRCRGGRHDSCGGGH